MSVRSCRSRWSSGPIKHLFRIKRMTAGAPIPPGPGRKVGSFPKTEGGPACVYSVHSDGWPAAGPGSDDRTGNLRHGTPQPAIPPALGRLPFSRASVRGLPFAAPRQDRPPHLGMGRTTMYCCVHVWIGRRAGPGFVRRGRSHTPGGDGVAPGGVTADSPPRFDDPIEEGTIEPGAVPMACIVDCLIAVALALLACRMLSLECTVGRLRAGSSWPRASDRPS